MPSRQSAAMNNARWCDLMCRLHGAPGKFASSHWMNTGNVPPFYPNFVTTFKDDPKVHLVAIERLIGAAKGKSLSVKDSFQVLDLHPLGFAKLLVAQWYAAWPSSMSRSRTDPKAGGEWLDTESGLGDWEAAWRADGAVQELPDRPFFPASLLGEPGVGVLAFRDSRAIVGGALTYQWNDTVGITNVFGRTASGASVHTMCFREAADRRPAATIVGYESGETVQVLERHGATAIGPLTVWLRAA